MNTTSGTSSSGQTTVIGDTTIQNPWAALTSICAVLGPNPGCSECSGCDYEMAEAHGIAAAALKSAGLPLPYAKDPD